jgi:hypothetical protein
MAPGEVHRLAIICDKMKAYSSYKTAKNSVRNFIHNRAGAGAGQTKIQIAFIGIYT